MLRPCAKPVLRVLAHGHHRRLVVLFDFGLEPFATQVKQFWFGVRRAGLLV